MVNWSELSLFVGAVSASVASLIIAVQKSKCSTIDCGCVHCERVVRGESEDDEPVPEVEFTERNRTASRDAPLEVKELEANLRRV